MKRASDIVEDRLDRAASALSEAGIPYAVIGGLAVAAWVRTADDSADRGTPNVDLVVRPEDLDGAITILSAVFGCRDGLRFAEDDSALRRSAVRLWPLDKARIDPSVLIHSVTLEGTPTTALDDLVQGKLILWRRIDQVHLRDLIGVGLVDASWLDRLPAPLAARLKELLDDPEG